MAQTHNRTCEYPPRHGLQGLPEDDALTLFYALDSDKNEGIYDTPETKLKELIKRCDANPRVLETIVGYLRNMGELYELSDLLDDEKELNGILQNPAKALYDSQPDTLKRLLEALAIYNKPVPIEALVHLLKQDANEVRKKLSQLERNYAFLYNKENKTFSLRAADQHYIYQQIDTENRINQHKQAASYYRKVRKPQEDWKRIEDLQANLDEFEQLIKAQDYDDACDVLINMDFHYLLPWGYIKKVQTLHELLQDKVLNTTLKRIHLGRLGIAYGEQGEFQKSAVYLKKSLQLANENGDLYNAGIAQGNLGNLYLKLGDTKTALVHLEPAFSIAREINDYKSQATHGGNIGIAYSQVALFEEKPENQEALINNAIHWLKAALEIAQKEKMIQGQISFLNALGTIFRDWGDFQTAIFYYQQSLDIAKNKNYIILESQILCDIGQLYAMLTDLKPAFVCYLIAYHLLEENNSLGRLMVMMNLRLVSGKIDNFSSFLLSLFPSGDPILNTATKQNYTFFRDAPKDFTDQILQALAEA